MTATALRGLSRFAAGQGIPASPQFLLDYDVIEAFCVAGLPGRACSTRGTYRSALYRLAEAARGPAGQRPTPFPGAKAPAPYSPGEQAELAALAAAQRDPAKRSWALAMVVFGIGAGLRPSELVALRGDDIVRHGRRVMVQLSGPTARVMPVTSRYAGRAGELARRTGRPRPLPVRAMLTALLCLALEDRPLFLTDATRLLFCQISGTSRRMLGVTGAITTQRAFLAAYRRVRYCFGAIRSVMDPFALPKNRRLTEDDLKARTRPMTPAQAEAARGRLEAFINALPEASISVLASEERAAYDGCTGLDATPVPLFSRGPSKRTGLCASDPDGGWYVREGDHREREDDKGKPLRKICWGSGGHHRHHGPPARRAARAPGSRHGPGAGPARARPRRHRRPGPGLCRRPRAQGRLARLRAGLHRCATRAIPAASTRPGLPAGHGLPDRPARHPG